MNTKLPLALAAACAATLSLAPRAWSQTPASGLAESGARRRAIALTRSAETAFYRRDFAATIALCRRANRADPTYARAYTWLGAAYEERRQFDAAREAYGRVLQLAPSGPDAAHVRARLRVLGTAPAPASAVATPTTTGAVARRSIAVSLNGQVLPTRAVIGSSSRVLLPMRELFEALGAQVFFDAPTQTIAATRGQTSIELHPGEASARVNGQNVNLDEPARLSQGVTLVPLRLVGEALGARVVYRPESDQVELSVPPLDPSTQPNIAALPVPATRPNPALGAPALPPPARPSPPRAPVVAPQATGPSVGTTRPVEAAPPVEPVIEAAPALPPAPRPATPVETAPDVVNPGAMNLAPTVSAQEFVVGGRLNPVTRVRVGGRILGGVHLLSGEDPDLSFRLDEGQKFFEVRVALPDNAPGEWTEFLGWFDDNPNREAFPLMRVYRGRAPVLLRVPLEGATRLTLSPGFPGHPLALIAPRFTGLPR